MAGKITTSTVAGGGEESFFAAVDALTDREMRAVSGLLALQIEGRDPLDAAALAEALADAADSFAEAADDE